MPPDAKVHDLQDEEERDGADEFTEDDSLIVCPILVGVGIIEWIDHDYLNYVVNYRLYCSSPAATSRRTYHLPVENQLTR